MSIKTTNPKSIGHVEGGTRSGRTRQKPQDLSVCESEERGRGKGVCVYTALRQSDEVHPSGREEGDTRSGRTRKKPKVLIACESEERGSGV